MVVMADGSFSAQRWGVGVTVQVDDATIEFTHGGELPEPKQSVDASVVEAMALVFDCVLKLHRKPHFIYDVLKALGSS
jgi:hypothetical protein